MSFNTADIALPRRQRVLFMGLFPPPVDGQRLVTQRVFDRLDALTRVARYDVDQFPRFGRVSKLVSAIVACFVIVAARMRGYSTLYLAPHSGAGLALSCLIALVSRCLGCRLAIHYHSYRNMACFSRLMATFIALCGPDAIHIVLAPPMARDLQHFYSGVRRVAVVSNAVFVPSMEVIRAFDGRRLRVGHLSNLSRGKGITIVLDCMRELRARGIDVELWLAGPTEDPEITSLIDAARVEFGDRVNYLGRLGAADVRRFYQNIDIFLFPTLHKHEAEPLVLIDAVSAGVPVIATDRGCIGYLLGTAGSRVLAATSFVEQAVRQITIWADRPDELAGASRAARARFVEVQRESKMQLDRLFAILLDGQLPAFQDSQSGRRNV
jgi:glycosyltransferase involved in cell wall biosynthesis